MTSYLSGIKFSAFLTVFSTGLHKINFIEFFGIIVNLHILAGALTLKGVTGVSSGQDSLFMLFTMFFRSTFVACFSSVDPTLSKKKYIYI